MFSNPFYYIILIAALIALTVLLWWMIKRRRHDEKVIREYQQKMDELRRQKKEDEQKKYRTYREKQAAERRAPANPKNHYTTYNEREDEYIPKYAAGCDMDRINRHYPRQPQDSVMVPVICIIVMLAAAVSPYLDRHNLVRLPGSPPPVTQLTGNIKVEMRSSIWSEDGKNLTIVTAYTNDSAAACHNARTSFQLIGENGVVLQTYQGKNLGTVMGYETIELTTTIPLKVDPSQVKQIYGKIEYFK